MRQTASIIFVFGVGCADEGGITDKADHRDSGATPSDTAAPTVTLTAPLDGATLTGTASLAATAADDIGVASVSFRVDGNEVASDASSPYEASWDTTTAINGNYRISAVAIDAAGNEAEVSATAVVENEGGPSSDAIRIINPVDGASICGRVTVEAAVSLDGATVIYALDGTDVATDSDAPFTWEWNTESTSNGGHRLRATATDSDGASVQNSISIDVANTGAECDNLPSVTLTAPDADTYTRGDVALSADASDDVGVLKVQFFMDNGLLIEDSAIPYETSWPSDSFAEGPHSLKAIAYDTASQTAETRITVTVDRTSPTVEITAPGEGDTVDGSVEITADIDENLAIDVVEFFVDGDSVGTSMATPFAVDWDTTDVAYGAHTVEVVATDRAGNQGIDSLAVNVDNPPSVRITDPNDGDDVGGAVAVSVTAADDLGINTVMFSVDGVTTSTAATAPYDFVWDTCDVTKGSHELRASATDESGNVASDTISVTKDQALGIELVSPTGAIEASETLVAYVADDDGISSVVFDLDGTKLATVRTSSGAVAECALSCGCESYESAWDVSSVAVGTYTLTATVTNAAGDSAADSYTITIDHDADSDGFDGETWGGDDCDDNFASVNPDADEVCGNFVDDDCDGSESSSCSLADAEIEFTGEAAVDFAGTAISGAGDVNADGYDDVLIGASANDDGNSAAGAAYLILGSSAPVGFGLASADAQYTGEDADDYAGVSVSGVGDVNADGYDDVLIGAYGSGSTGGAYLLLGAASPVSTDLGAASAEFTGEAGFDYAGISVSGAGDMNDDGFADLVIGASRNDDGPGNSAGAAYVVLGRASPTSIGLASATAEYVGVADSDYAGTCVAGAGDVDADGYDDVIIGAYANDDGPGSDPGAAYVVLGSSAPRSSSLSSADAVFSGEAQYDRAGVSVAAAGDVNADGYGDVIIGSQYNDDGADEAGAAYLVLGSAAPRSVGLSSASAEFSGVVANDGAGQRVAGGGDVDADGYDDMLVGAYWDGGDGEGDPTNGTVYVVLGGASLTSSSLSSADADYGGEASDDGAADCAGAGDVDGNGYADILIGASGNDDAGNYAGAAYLILAGGF